MANHAWYAVRSLAWREVIRFFRQRNRVAGAMGQPLLFWLLFSVGLNRSFQLPGQDFGHYYLPGTLLLILLFTAIFATISIIEDRKEGFLQAVLVAPVPRWAPVLGKVLGGSVIALVQGLFFLTLALAFGERISFIVALEATLLMTIVAIGLTSLGFVIAWRLDSTQGFHAIMSLLLMPMWLLSGAFFPIPAVDAQATWGETIMHYLMRCNPTSYAVAGLRRLLFDARIIDQMLTTEQGLWLPALGSSVLVCIAFTVLMFGLACRVAARHTSGDLL